MQRWLSILMVAVGAFGISACSGGGNGNPRDGGVDPLECEDFVTPPPGCDEPCPSGDSDCQEGTFCFNGVCSAQCTAEEGCVEGATCNARGRCVPDMGTGGTSGTGGSNGCQSVQVTPTRSIPNVMFLVDQSGSMTAGFGGGQDRWEAAHSAITDIVDDLDSIVRFGLTTYTSDDGNDPCPLLPTQVDFDLDNSGTIGDPMIYSPTYPDADGDETPTGDSIDALVSIIQSDPPPSDGPTIIVLATDGEPDTCEQPNPQNGQAEAVAAATAAHAVGIETFILSVGDQVGEPHLQDMANVGIGLAEDGSQGNAPFWVGNDPQELEDAFNEIISASISCEIEINKPFDDVDIACSQGDVRLNGIPLSCPSEWRVKPGVDNVIELVGSACDTFKSGDSTFTAVFPCGAIIVE
jgi:hypothetical protein